MIWNIWPFLLCLILFSLVQLSKLIIFIRCEQLVFFKHVFIFIIIFQRINNLPLISTIFLIKEVILLNFSFLISLMKNVSFYCFLFQSWLRQSYSFFCFFLFNLNHLYVHMIMYLFHHQEYTANHQKQIKIFYFFHKQ